MYKKVCLIICITLFLIPICYAPPTSDSSQAQTTDIINKIMQNAQKEIAESINKNQDENFKVLDQRIYENNRTLFQKAIFALAGIFTIVLFTYAFVMNKINKHYDVRFYEKMIDAKIARFVAEFTMTSFNTNTNSLYPSVTEADDKFLSPEHYFDRFTPSFENEQLKSQLIELQDKLKMFEKPIPEAKPQKPFMQRILITFLKLVVMFVIIAIVATIIYVYFIKKPSGLANLFTTIKGGV